MFAIPPRFSHSGVHLMYDLQVNSSTGNSQPQERVTGLHHIFTPCGGTTDLATFKTGTSFQNHGFEAMGEMGGLRNHRLLRDYVAVALTS